MRVFGRVTWIVLLMIWFYEILLVETTYYRDAGLITNARLIEARINLAMFSTVGVMAAAESCSQLPLVFAPGMARSPGWASDLHTV